LGEHHPLVVERAVAEPEVRVLDEVAVWNLRPLTLGELLAADRSARRGKACETPSVIFTAIGSANAGADTAEREGKM